MWKHPNLRIAYMAQHAFHHVEQHLKSTPADYFWWRFASGEDREGMMKVTRKMSAAEVQSRDDAIREVSTDLAEKTSGDCQWRVEDRRVVHGKVWRA